MARSLPHHRGGFVVLLGFAKHKDLGKCDEYWTIPWKHWDIRKSIAIIILEEQLENHLPSGDLM